MISNTDQYIINAYVEQKKSTYVIANEIGSYANKVKRVLENHGVKLRTKSEAQGIAIEKGRHKHPTKGTKRSETTKIKISESVAAAWASITPEEKERRIQLAKDNWDDISEIDKSELRRLAAEAVRDTAKNGSKLEKYLLIELGRRGYKVEFHRENLVANEKLQTDLFLPDANVIIEIDGPAHFFPIWGEDSLTKHLNADRQKNGLLIESGYCVIRIKHLVKTISEIHKRKVLTKIVDLLQSIKEKFPEPNYRLIEVEVV